MDLKDSRIESNPMYSFYIDFFKLKAKHLISSLLPDKQKSYQNSSKLSRSKTN